MHKYSFSLSLVLLAYCAVHLVQGAYQSFRVRPSNETVVVGHSVVLQCHIDDRNGTVIWLFRATHSSTHVRLAANDIQWNPTLPQKIQANLKTGEFDLLLQTVTLEMEGWYTCRVMDNYDHPFLESKAYVTVSVPPTTVTINEEEDGSSLDVIASPDVFSLTCSAPESRPIATLAWFLDDAEITEGVTLSNETSRDAGSNLTLVTSKNTLELRPERRDNDKQYECRASHPALAATPLTASVTLNVLYPPDTPSIRGQPLVPSTGELTVRRGEEIAWSCRVKGGNPRPTVYWHKNGVAVMLQSQSVGDEVESVLPVFEAGTDDNGAIYSCHAQNTATSPGKLTASVKLKVEYAPESATISGHGSAGEGEMVSLSCSSAQANPPADVFWLINGQPTTNGTPTKQEVADDGSSVGTSVLNVTVTEARAGAQAHLTVTCYAQNARGRSEFSSHQVSVAYPPNQPVIEMLGDIKYFRPGSSAEVTCIVQGGYPSPNVTWWKGGEMLTEGTRLVEFTGSRRLALSVSPPREDNGVALECKAYNDATPQPLVTAYVMNVTFPPASVSVVQGTAGAVAGRPHAITCTSASSNPPARLTWLKGNSLMDAQLYTETYQPSAHNGTATVSVLTFEPAAGDDGAKVSCRARNTLLNTDVQNSALLNLTYAPYFPYDPEEEAEVTTNVNASLLLTYAATGKPATDHYVWFFEGRRLGWTNSTLPATLGEGASAVAGTLNLTSVQRHHMGTWTVTAVNSVGSTSWTFKLFVQYEAVISALPEQVVVDPGQDAEVTCVIDSYPVPPGLVTWLRPDFDMSRVTTSESGNRSTIHVSKVEKEDVGVFTCSAWNGIGDTVSRDVKVLVNFAPESASDVRQFAATPGKHGELKCEALGGPTVDFTWLLGERELPGEDPHYAAEVSNPTLAHHVSTLYVYNITRADFSNYTCRARNRLGQVVSLMRLDETSPPEPPQSLTEVNKTHDSVTVKIEPGFDGGHEQNFVLRYRAEGADGYTTQEVVPVGALVFKVKGLTRGTKYEMTAKARNKLGESLYMAPGLTVTTSDSITGSESAASEKDDVPLIIILCVSIIGMVLLGLNVLLIVYLMRRRRRRLHKALSESSGRNTDDYYGGDFPLGNTSSGTDESRTFDTASRSGADSTEITESDVDEDLLEKRHHFRHMTRATPSPIPEVPDYPPGGPPPAPVPRHLRGTSRSPVHIVGQRPATLDNQRSFLLQSQSDVGSSRGEPLTPHEPASYTQDVRRASGRNYAAGPPRVPERSSSRGRVTTQEQPHRPASVADDLASPSSPVETHGSRVPIMIDPQSFPPNFNPPGSESQGELV